VNHLRWLLPLLLLAGGTLLFRFTDLDLNLIHSTWNPAEAFHSSETGIWGFLYRFAPYPAIAIALWSLIHLLVSWRLKWLRRHNRMAWFFLASMALGPGLIVNTTLKDHYGRPRPKQVEEFGGAYAFLPILTPGPHRDARSFPSGHASIAFFLLTPFFVCRKRRWLGAAFLLVGLVWGTLVGLARMHQGGHWPSDVLWAAGVVYFVGFGLSRAFGFRRNPPRVSAYSL